MRVSPRLVLVGCNVQDPHTTYQCYEEFPMGGNKNVCNFCRIVLLGELRLQE